MKRRGQSAPGGRNSQGQGPEAGRSLGCWRNIRVTSVAELHERKGEKMKRGGDGVSKGHCKTMQGFVGCGEDLGPNSKRSRKPWRVVRGGSDVAGIPVENDGLEGAPE